MSRALLRILLEILPHGFWRKILTLGTRYKTSYDCAGTIPTNIGIISTSAGIILTHVGTIPTLERIIPTLYIMCIGTNSTVWEYFIQNFLMSPYMFRNHASYTSVNFGTSQKNFMNKLSTS